MNFSLKLSTNDKLQIDAGMKKVRIKKHVTSNKPAGAPGGNFGWGDMRHDFRNRCIALLDIKVRPPYISDLNQAVFNWIEFQKNPPNSICHFQKAQNIILFQISQLNLWNL